MRKILPLTVALFIGLTFFCCNSNERRLKKEIQQVLANKIEMPTLTSAVYEGVDTLIDRSFFDAPARMIIYFDSTVCGSCHISRLWEWEEITKYYEETNGKFVPIFIFSPGKGKAEGLKTILEIHSIKWPVFIDEENAFDKLNEHLPRNIEMHTFVMDKNNKPIMVGRPVNNENLWRLYKDVVDNLIENDGIFVTETE